ncbi:hypothetical protein GCM10027570_52610 [Streptomonospora sediminis]
MNADRSPGTAGRTTAGNVAGSDGRSTATSRQRLYDLQQPRFDLPAIAIGALAGHHRTVLDLGCGEGEYLHRLRSERPAATTIGIDAEPGMVDDLPGPVLCADAAVLPVKNACVDAVLAMHLLYHLPDVDSALAEIGRVLTPGGILIASTNAEDDKQELDDLWQAAAGDVLGAGQVPHRTRLSDRFPLDTGADRLREDFADVEVQELTGSIEVGEPALVLDHLGSYRAWAAQAGVPFGAILRRARERLEQAIETAGTFTITTRQGVIFAQRP